MAVKSAFRMMLVVLFGLIGVSLCTPVYMWLDAEFANINATKNVLLQIYGASCAGAIGEAPTSPLKSQVLVVPNFNGWSQVNPDEISKVVGQNTNYYWTPTPLPVGYYTVWIRTWAFADGTSAFWLRLQNGQRTSFTVTNFTLFSPVGVARWTWHKEEGFGFNVATSDYYTFGFDYGTDLCYLDKFLITNDWSYVPADDYVGGTASNLPAWGCRPPATRTFELEDTSVFSLSQGLVTRDEITASGGKADTILTGTNPFLSSPPTVTFKNNYHFQVPMQGLFSFWLRAMAFDNDSNEIYLKIDNNNAVSWQLNTGGRFMWNMYSCPVFLVANSDVGIFLELKEHHIFLDKLVVTVTDAPSDPRTPAPLVSWSTCYLDMTIDYVLAYATYTLPTSSFTIEMFSYWSFPYAVKYLFAFGETTGEFVIYTDASDVVRINLKGTPISTGYVLPTGKLVVLGVSYDKTNGKLEMFVNSTSVWSTTSNSYKSLTFSTSFLTIGQKQRLSGTTVTYPQIDTLHIPDAVIYEIRVWNTLRTAAQISYTERPAGTANLINLWTWDECKHYTVDQVGGVTLTAIPSEWRALLNLYQSMGGPFWKTNANWTSFQNPCMNALPQWYGIFCDMYDRVSIINLAYNNLTGSFPENQGLLFSVSLPHLKYLFLHDNNISGTIPPDLQYLPNMTHLYLYENKLSGTVPPSIGDYPKIKKLYMSHNYLTGSIPSALSKSSTLEYLDIGFNLLTGHIPDEISSMRSLKSLDVQSNQLDGDLPYSLVNSRIFSIQIRNNSILGTIPNRDNKNDTGMSLMDFSYNDLSCYLPKFLQNLNITYAVRLYGLTFWCPLDVARSVVGASCEFASLSSISPTEFHVEETVYPTVTLEGSGFMGARCKFGIRVSMTDLGYLITPLTVTDTTVTFTLPPHDPGTVKIQLVWLNESWALTNYVAFKYIKQCPNNCSSPNGFCVDNILGLCKCQPQFFGVDCSLRKCPNNCTGHGKCNTTTGVCKCDDGWEGSACTFQKLSCPNNCSHNGTCDYNTGVCYCYSKIWGADCSKKACPPYNEPYCSGHGQCNPVNGTCLCDPGWIGTSCSIPMKSCPNNCTNSTFGSCDWTTGTCICKTIGNITYGGDDCSLVVCARNCSGHGHCDPTTGWCICDTSYTKMYDCSMKYVECPGNCNGTSSGLCDHNLGVCYCKTGRKGSDCSLLMCPGYPDSECSLHGLCDTVDGKCECYSNSSGYWSGVMCSTFIWNCPNNCSNVVGARCDITTGICHCPSNRLQPDCALFSCPNDCSGNGVCNKEFGNCSCIVGWKGYDCSISYKPCNESCKLPGGTCNYETGVCVCVYGYGPVGVCTEKVCPLDCNGNGLCNKTNGRCECFDGWSGIDCTTPYVTCSSDCGDHGYCNYNIGNCSCYSPYFGDTCSLKDCPNCDPLHGVCDTTSGQCTCPDTNWESSSYCRLSVCRNYSFCNSNLGYGKCDQSLGECMCSSSHYGHSCEYWFCPNNCSSHGTCNNRTGKCTCLSDFSGTDCSIALKPCPNNCSWHGSCNRETGQCLCYSGWFENDCSKYNCPTCVHGNCTYKYPPQCLCDYGWTGSGCDIQYFACLHSCSGHGTCNTTTGSCICSGSASGVDCSILQCPSNCSNHGTCNTTTGLCSCDEGYIGLMCQTPYTNCSTPCIHGRCNTTAGTCTCTGTFQLPDCSTATCKYNCSVKGGGSCDTSTGLCVCFTGSNYTFYGSSCDMIKYNCTPPCVNGICDQFSGKCRCDTGYTGATCDQKKCPGSPPCAGHGTCNGTTGECICEQYHDGTFCQNTHIPCPNNCTDYKHGVCNELTGECLCTGGFYSILPDYPDCRFKNCTPPDCSGKGTCNLLTGVCTCIPDWGGISCNLPNKTCPLQCSYHGSCNLTIGKCKCWASYTGDACEFKLCPQNCNGNGFCNMTTGICSCYPGFHGPSCNLRDCLNNCSSHGSCNSQTGNCSCFAFDPTNMWGGPDCSQRICYLSCSKAGSCNQGKCKCKTGHKGKYCEDEDYLLIGLVAAAGAVVLVGGSTCGFIVFRHYRIKQLEKEKRDRMEKYKEKDSVPFGNAFAD